MGGCLSLKKKKDEVRVVQENEKKESSEVVQVENSDSDNRPAPNFGEIFTYQELAAATKNFRPKNLLGKGGLGPAHRGFLERIQQEVAIKKLDEQSFSEVRMLSHLDHPNLVKLIGSCAERDQKLIVCEFISSGSLRDHLHGGLPFKKTGLFPFKKMRLNWNTRMKIAVGVAKGLEYLHNEEPPVIHRDLKSSNVLLGQGYHPKLSHFGLARLGPQGDVTNVSTRVMGTYGYCAPEYLLTGRLTLQSNIYSLGVVLLELITGRKPVGEDSDLVSWAKSQLKNCNNFQTLVDPVLYGDYPENGLSEALAVTELCLQEHNSRPLIGTVVSALSSLVSQSLDPNAETSGSGTNSSVDEIESQEPQRNSPASRRKEGGVEPKEWAKVREGALMHIKDT